MKKLFSFLLVALAAVMTANAQVEFSYEAGAELVSSYLWRGQYNGGLSFQPYASVGYEGEVTSFSAGAWFNLGPSDWGFRKETTATILGEEVGLGDGTYFNPEMDLSLSFTFFGVTVGLTHYYYFDGGNFLGWKNVSKWAEDDYTSGSTTELMVGYNFSETLPEEHNLYINWNTMVAGADTMSVSNDLGVVTGVKQNYSSYLEVGYDYTWESLGLTLGGQIGIVPWGSDYYGNEKFAVKNLSVKLNKMWEFDACELDLFAVGMIDPDLMASDHESVFVKASGIEKVGCQSLNGSIGLGIWF